MSYEGYSRFLCKNGHLWTKDSMLLMYNDEKQFCPKCGESEVWENMVDVTNGSSDDDGERIDGYVELEVEGEIAGECSCCGEKHICQRIYKIPEED